jgi:hypothetical protein
MVNDTNDIQVAPTRRKSRRDAKTNSARKHAATDISKLTKLIRLLSSDHPGEVIATVTAMRRTLHAAGLDFPTPLPPLLRPACAGPQNDRRHPGNHRPPI